MVPKPCRFHLFIKEPLDVAELPAPSTMSQGLCRINGLHWVCVLLCHAGRVTQLQSTVVFAQVRHVENVARIVVLVLQPLLYFAYDKACAMLPSSTNYCYR